MIEPDGSAPKPLVFVTVGTDHHPFDRLMEWVDGWAEAGGGARARILVQSGTSRAPRLVPSKPYLEQQEMRGALAEAVALVSHGGTATALEARDRGVVPIVVPRRGDLGEHVDDHQVAFARRLAADGGVCLAETRAELASLLDRALEDPQSLRTRARSGGDPAAVERFGSLVGLAGTASSADGPGPRVLYIGGVGRSGTTLLDRMLGQLPGFLSTGELVHLWSRGVLDNELCACGARFRECELWSEVGRIAFGGWENVDALDALERQRAVERTRFIPLMVASGLNPEFARRLRAFAEVMIPVYRAISKASGGRIIVDSSKHASYAFLLRRLAGVDLRVVQVVRESRGVAYSWTKRVRRPEVVDREDYMSTAHPLRMGARWTAHNVLFDVLRSLGVPTMLLRYESLVEDPLRRLIEVARFAGEEPGERDLEFLRDGEAEFERTHNVAGNPMRFRSGPVAIRRDEEWRERMPARDRAFVSSVTWPLLVRYGYMGKKRA